MSAQAIEGLLVFSACIALGVTLLVVDARRLPSVLQSMAKSRYRVQLGVGMILLGLVMTASTIVGDS